MARPRKEIDADEVFKLAKRGCSQHEIADHFGVAQSTISLRFRSDYELGAAQSKTWLRSMQFRKASEGCSVMLKHLGMVYLGQSEKSEVRQTTELTVGPTQDLEAALEAFGYVRPGTTVGTQEPGTLCDTGEPGPMADQGCTPSQGAQ